MGSVDDMQSLRMELAKKERELQEQLKLSQQLWEEKRSLENKIEVQQRDCENWKEQLANQKQRYSKRTTNLEQEAEHQLQNLEEDLKSHREDLAAARAQLVKQRATSSELRKEKDQVLSELQRLTTERDQQVRICDSYEQRLAQTKEERDRFSKKLVTMSSELEDERRRTKSLQEEKATFSLRCKKLSEDLQQMEDYKQRYEEEFLQRQSLLRRLNESENAVDQLRLHLNHSQPMTPTSSTPGFSLYNEISPFSTTSQHRSLVSYSEEEMAEKDGSQMSPTSVAGRLPMVGEEMEMEVTPPILAWEVEDSSTTCCHRCSDLEVKLVQSQKEVEHAQQELKQARQVQEQAQWPLKKSECRNSQTKPTDTDLQLPQEPELQAEQTEELSHYINKYNDCQKKLQEKSQELSECRKELDDANRQLHRAAEQKFHLNEELKAWQDDFDLLLQEKLMEEVRKQTKPARSAKGNRRSSTK